MMGRLETMKLLIKLGADVNAKNSTGSTPLHAASLNGYGECMELLVDKGAYHPVEPARAAEFFFHFFFFGNDFWLIFCSRFPPRF
jgi:ankyrin repeat protein